MFTGEKALIAIFDNDGTICDTQDVEGRCYALAIKRVTGMSLSTLDWTAYDEPTSSAIVRGLLTGDVAAKEKEEQIKFEFCRLLQEERSNFPGDFLPIAGAVEFIEREASLSRLPRSRKNHCCFIGTQTAK